MKNDIMKVGDLYEKVNAGDISSDIDLQREIVYGDEKQRLVIDSLINGIPLPAFYFWEGDGGKLETLDGKQRINAITRFMQNDLEYEGKIWRQIDKELQGRIQAVELSCIICNGPDELKREIFKRINTLGVPLSKYEVLNGLFHGEYLRGLTAYVTKDRGALKVLGANKRGKNQLQVLQWLQLANNRAANDANINEWVSARKDDSFAADQRQIDRYIDFMADVFEDMKILQIQFGLALRYVGSRSLWKQHAKEINKAVKAYKKSDSWTLSNDKAGDVEALALACVGGIELDPRRFFTADQKRELLDRAGEVDGKYPCACCGKLFFPDELEADHVEAWSKGGRTEISNGAVLCRACNTAKSNS